MLQCYNAFITTQHRSNIRSVCYTYSILHVQYTSATNFQYVTSSFYPSSYTSILLIILSFSIILYPSLAYAPSCPNCFVHSSYSFNSCGETDEKECFKTFVKSLILTSGACSCSGGISQSCILSAPQTLQV